MTSGATSVPPRRRAPAAAWFAPTSPNKQSTPLNAWAKAWRLPTRAPRSRAAPGAASTERLTPREREIALLAAARWSNAEIAEELVLSVRTVETYVLRACRKLGVERRTELARVLTLHHGS